MLFAEVVGVELGPQLLVVSDEHHLREMCWSLPLAKAMCLQVLENVGKRSNGDNR